MNTRMILILVTTLLLSACGQITKVKHVNNVDYRIGHEKAEVQLLETEMWAYAGIRETKAIKAGHFYVSKLDFSTDLFRELFPGRITYYAWTVNRRTKKEFFTQLVLSGFDENDEPFVQAIIDGDESTGMIPEECNILALSTKFNRAYDAGGTMHPLDAESFSESPEYRLAKVVELGDKVADLKVIANGKKLVYDILAHWNSFKRKSDGARFYTPLSETQMKKLARLNPQYDFWNKYKYNAKLLITPNYVAMGISAAFDIAISANAPSWGPDFDSMIKRDDMGLAIAYIIAFSKQNSQKVANLMYERMVTESYIGKKQPRVNIPKKKVEIAQTVAIKPISIKPKLAKKTFNKTNSSHIWRDYRSEGRISQGQAVRCLERSLAKLGISNDAIVVFKRMILSNGGYKYLVIHNGDKLLGVSINGKIIYRAVTVKWKKELLPLPVKRYRLVNNQTNKMYSIGLTDYGHWVRFK